MYRVWFVSEAAADLAEGRDESIAAGSIAEPDVTDVVERTWSTRLPAAVSVSPAETRGDRGDRKNLTATVVDADGEPIPGASIEWDASGRGRIVTADSITNEHGRARATLRSRRFGDQVVTVSTGACTKRGDCTDRAVIHWVPAKCDIFGTNRNDALRGTRASEVLCGLSGRDRIRGFGGNDRLLGGAGNDTLKGSRGRDRLRGGRGRDRLYGERGRDRLRGGRGRDRLYGGRGRDKCSRDRIRRSCDRRRG